MRIPYSWLGEWVSPLGPPEEVAERLTMAGLEVEAIERVGDEAVLVAKITPNRGDWLSVRGVAREVAAIYGTAMTGHDLTPPREAGWRTEELAKVTIEDDELCPRYSALIITGVKVGHSPDWMAKMLLCAGLRPIDNVVDATNYVLMELGQPLHAFDLDRLAEARIIVRRAREGEVITTIDGKERVLPPEDLVIADPSGPVALAGVMGGGDTEVGEGTRRVLLESAHFAPSAVRRTSKAQGLPTEASYRFERWVDPNGTVEALNRAAQLIVETAGGEVGRGAIDVYPRRIGATTVPFRPERANALLGTRIAPEKMVAIFRGLGFEVEGEKQLTVTVPTFRNDISREEDLVEEVARLYGYDRIPSAVPKGTGMMARQSEELRVAAKARDVLTRCGLTEVVTFSLTRPEAEAETAGNKELVRLSNPLVEEFSGLRGSLLPSLLGVAARNFERGTRETSVFEVGKTYEQKADGSCSERWLAGVLISGEGGGQSEDGAEFYRAKAIVEAAAKEFGASPVVVESANRDFYAGGRSGALVREGQVVAEWGQVKQSVAQGFDLPAAFYAEIDLERLGQVWGEDGTRIEYAPIPRYPAARRDLAAEIPEEMTFGELEALVRRNSDELLVEVNVFDVYRGRQIPEGKKSLAVRLGFQASDRTLTDEEVTGRLESIISGLESRGGIRVRKAAG